MIGIVVRAHGRGAWGMVEEVSGDGAYAFVTFGKRSGRWFRMDYLVARAGGGREMIAAWIARREQAAVVAIEFPTIAIEEETGRRKIRTDEL